MNDCQVVVAVLPLGGLGTRYRDLENCGRPHTAWLVGVDRDKESFFWRRRWTLDEAQKLGCLAPRHRMALVPRRCSGSCRTIDRKKGFVCRCTHHASHHVAVTQSRSTNVVVVCKPGFSRGKGGGCIYENSTTRAPGLGRLDRCVVHATEYFLSWASAISFLFRNYPAYQPETKSQSRSCAWYISLGWYQPA